MQSNVFCHIGIASLKYSLYENTFAMENKILHSRFLIDFPGINSPENYQLAFVTPGISPFEAISRN